MPTTDHRLELRLSSRDDDLITEAAGLVGVSVSEFLLARAVCDAEAIVEARRAVRLEQDAYGRFLAALDAPPEPVPTLVDQIRRSRALTHGD